MGDWFDLNATIFSVVGLVLGAGVLWRYYSRRTAMLERQQEAKLGALEAQLAELRQQNQHHTTNDAARQQQLAAREREAREYREQLAQTQRALDEQTQAAAAAHTELQRAIAAKEQALTRQAEEIAAVQEQLAHVLNLQSQEATDLRTEVATQRQRQSELAEELAMTEAVRDGLLQTIEELQAQSREETIRLADLETELTNTTRVASQLQRQLNQVRRDRLTKSEQLYRLEEAHVAEVTLRRRLAAGIGALQRLLDGANTPATAPTPDTPATPDPEEIHPPPAAAPARAEQPQEQSTDLDTTSAANGPIASERIIRFLTTCDIALLELPLVPEEEPTLDALANELATQYSDLKPLHTLIKRSLNYGNNFTLRLNGQSAATIKRIHAFGQRAHAAGLLAHFYRSPAGMKAKSSSSATAQGFFSGRWLERYIVQQVQMVVDGLQAEQASTLAFAYLSNLKIVLPTGAHRELDLLFHVNGHFFWIEVKSSDYHQYIQKYSEMSTHMQLDPQHAILVVTELSDNHALFRDTHSINIYAMHEFANRIRATIKEDLANDSTN